MIDTPYDAVLLIAFGGPEKMEDVRPFLENVLRGRPVPKERFEEVVHHYELIGGRSPLNELTEAQRAALEAELAARGAPLPVAVGMRNWTPTIAETLATLSATNVRQVLGIIMAAHNTEASNERYRHSVEAALEEVGDGIEVHYGAGFHEASGFIEANALAIKAAREHIDPDRRDAAPLILTAHSIPVAMARASPYEAQLQRTAIAVTEAAGYSTYRIAYQSRSGAPQDPWLEPDILDVLRDLSESGIRDAVVSPIGFVCDHVEVLYDLDIEAAELGRNLGLTIHRAQAANSHPAFIGALADLVTGANR